MSANTEVCYQTFIRRLRKQAVRALEAYGLEDAKLKFFTYTGNGHYHVIIPPSRKSVRNFSPGKYVLRLHQPNYMRPEHISSELEWLSALHKEGIKVPEPFRNLEGNWLTSVESDFEIPVSRNCTILRWVEGRQLKKNIRPQHFVALGRMIGTMQEQSRHWKKPKGFSRRHWDWEGLYGDGAEYGIPAKEVHPAVPKAHQSAFNKTLQLVQEASDQMGKGKKVYGLIHADFGVDANVLFKAGEALPIDFDDSGFGYWVFDLGVVLAHYYSDYEDTSSKMKDALIEGYLETSNLPESNLDYLDLFTAARYAQFIYFYQGGGMLRPQHREESNREVKRYAKHLKRILKKL